MAVCLFPDCGFSRAVSLHATTTRAVERDTGTVLDRECHRVVYCPVCRRRSHQRITHEGETAAGKVKLPTTCDRILTSS